MSLISEYTRCEIAKWFARAILATITWTNIMSSLLALLHAFSVFSSIYGCSILGHHVVATQMLLMALMDRNEQELGSINAFQFKVKLVLASTIFQIAYHGTVIRVNWRLFWCYDFFRNDFLRRVRTWWWLQMSIVTMTITITMIEQVLLGELLSKEVEEVLYVLRRSYYSEWQLFILDLASLLLVKWYARIMCYVRFTHRLHHSESRR